MKCLVTGGAGFIGSNLVDFLLKLGHHVIVLDSLVTGRLSNLKKVKNKIKFIKIDITSNKSSIDKYFNKVDWVFHLAGLADNVPSIKNPKDYFQTNVEGTLNVLEASKRAKIKKLIYAASASCYGVPNKYPTDENAKIDPKYPYGLTKFLGEQLIIHWAKIYQMPNVSLRFFNVYGPRSRIAGPYSSVIGIFLKQKFSGKPLTVVGDGKQTRDFINVSDVVNVMVKTAQSKKNGEIYNIGSGKETSINLVASIVGGNKVKILKRPGEPNRSLSDISKIKKHLNWEPKIPISRGIKMLLKN